MIDRFLRRLTVRRRIVGVTLILVLLLAVSLPVIVSNQNFVVGRLRQITDVETRADRLLLLASTRVESSRVNVMRYIQDLAPSAYESLDDVDQAVQLLTEAQGLISSPEQKEAVSTILSALGDYEALVRQVEAARSGGSNQNITPLLSQSYRLGNDIGQRIEQIVSESDARVAAANEAVYAESRNRLIVLASAYAVALLVVLFLASLIQRSITRPVAELRRGAEAFLQGQMETTVSVVGTDELSLLARTFNQMAFQLHNLIATLEQQVADRTRDLQLRAVQLATAAEVGRAAASILELESLTRQVVSLIQDRFALYYVGLFLLDGSGHYAELEAGTGEAGRIMRQQGHRLEVGGQSMVGRACAQREARIALDVAATHLPGEDLTRFDNPLLPDTRSEMALPLMAAGRVLGALDVQSTQAAAFSAEDITILQLLADQVAVAIQNARLFSDVQAALEAERRAYRQISAEAWKQMSRARANLGYCAEEQSTFAVQEAASPAASQVLSTGKIVPGQDGAETLLAPLAVRGQVIGLIDAQKPEGTGGWTPEEMDLLQALTDQLGAALDAARLYEDTQRSASRERLTRDISDRMQRAIGIEALAQGVLQDLMQQLSASHAVLYLGTEEELLPRLGNGAGGEMVESDKAV